jgi:hypothetical protein
LFCPHHAVARRVYTLSLPVQPRARFKVVRKVKVMPTTSVPIFSASVDAPTQLDLRASCKLTVERHIVNLFKECLMIMEQLEEEHDESLDKLYSALPETYQKYVQLADHFTEEKADRIRRAILQRGNDCKRAVASELDQYDLTFRAK